jgi:hypothetical protein
MSATIILLASLLTLATTAPPDPCAGELLPAGLGKVLVTRYPGWKIVTLKDLHPDDQGIWLERWRQFCPGIAIGHFESQKQLSYAFLLLRMEGSDIITRLVVARQVGPKDFRTRNVTGPSPAPRPEVIFRAPPGEIVSWDGSQRWNATMDVIVLAQLEAAADAYYWKNGRFHSIHTSD